MEDKTLEKKNLLYYINQVEEKLLIYSFAVTVVLVFIQVVMRSLFNNSLSWSEELARYMFIWQCWLSVGLAERFQKHIRIEMITKKLPHTLKMAVEYLVIIMTVAVCVFFVYYGVQMVLFLVDAGTKSTALKIPMFIIYSAMPVGCVMYIMRLVIRFYQLATGKEKLS